MKKLLQLIITLSFILMFSINSPQKASPANELIPPAKLSIPVILKTENFPYWEAIKAGAKKAAKDYNIEVLIEAPKSPYPSNLNEQVDLLKNALTLAPKAIVLSAFNLKDYNPYFEQAKSANIPIISLDTDVDSPIVKTAVLTDNYGAGELAAHKMAELVDQKGKVAIVDLTFPIKSTLFRREGFVNTLKENYPNMEVVTIPYKPEPPQDLKESARTIIEENPDIKGVFATNERETTEILDVIKELNKIGQIKIIGFDSNKRILEAIREGLISGAITQDPVNMGYKAVEAAVKAVQGERLPEFINTDFAWYDKSNIDSPEIKAMLYE